MTISVITALHLRCIEADLRDYLMNPAEYRVTHLEDIHVLLLEIMRNLGVKPASDDENIDIDLDGGLSAVNEQGGTE